MEAHEACIRLGKLLKQIAHVLNQAVILLRASSQFEKNIVDVCLSSLITLMLGTEVQGLVQLKVRQEAILVGVNDVHHINHVCLLGGDTKSLNSVHKLQVRNQAVLIEIKDPLQANKLFLLTLVVFYSLSNLLENLLDAVGYACPEARELPSMSTAMLMR